MIHKIKNTMAFMLMTVVLTLGLYSCQRNKLKQVQIKHKIYHFSKILLSDMYDISNKMVDNKYMIPNHISQHNALDGELGHREQPFVQNLNFSDSEQTQAFTEAYEHESKVLDDLEEVLKSFNQLIKEKGSPEKVSIDTYAEFLTVLGKEIYSYYTSSYGLTSRLIKEISLVLKNKDKWDSLKINTSLPMQTSFADFYQLNGKDFPKYHDLNKTKNPVEKLLSYGSISYANNLSGSLPESSTIVFRKFIKEVFKNYPSQGSSADQQKFFKTLVNRYEKSRLYTLTHFFALYLNQLDMLYHQLISIHNKSRKDKGEYSHFNDSFVNQRFMPIEKSGTKKIPNYKSKYPNIQDVRKSYLRLKNIQHVFSTNLFMESISKSEEESLMRFYLYAKS